MDEVIKQLSNALRPFAIEANLWDKFHEDETIVEGWVDGPDSTITVGDLRRARSIYKSMGRK